MREFLLKSIKYFLFLLLFFSVNSGCDKIEDSVIPSIPFSYTISLTLHNEVNVPGNSIYIPEIGYGGVVVYCEYPGSFFAFDAACTNEVQSSCHIGNVGVVGSLAETCSCCGSEFVLIGGNPTKGPAVQALRPYRTSMVNGMLRVYNQ
jgi:nitrite reductase/ring-hydroxylating ferredoxin subunit